MNDSPWISAHLFYQGDLDRLLTEAVAPLVAELTAGGQAGDHFFLRYWERGPHVRLRVLPRSEADRAGIEQLVVARCRSFFAEHPSADVLHQDDYDATAAMLADRERMDTFARELHENNAVSFIPYRREHERYGYGASMEAVERHFGESSRLALRILTSNVPLGRRFTAAYAMLLLAWFVAEPETDRLLEWVGPDRSHALLPDQARLDLLTGWRQDQAEQIARQMRELASAVTTLPGSGALIEWARSADALQRALHAHNAVAPPEHRARVLAVLDVCAHLICNRLGVPLPVEGALRRFAAEAITVRTGEGSRSAGLA